MPGRRGRRAARRSWVPSRQRSAAAGSPHLARSRGEDRPLSASDEAQEGGGGGEGVKVKSSEAAAGPWAAASAGCFDHGGAVAVSFCSRGSSRAAGRPPWGPALPRPPAPPPTPAAAPGREDAGLGPTACRPLPTSPPLRSRSPPGRGQLLGRGAPAGPSCRLASPRGLGGWARCQGVLGTAAAPPPLLSAAHPARPPDSRSLTPRMHTLGRRRCCAPAGGRVRKATGTHYRGRVARPPPPPRPCTRGAHARAPHTHVRTAPEHAASAHVRAHPRTHTGTQGSYTHPVPGSLPRATGGPGTWSPLQPPHFLPGSDEGMETGTLPSGSGSTARAGFCLVRSAPRPSSMTPL